MKRAYKIFRTIIVTLVVLAVLIPVALYVAISLPSVQDKIKGIAENELTKTLDTKVTIGTLSFIPFNNATLNNVTIYDQRGDTALHVNRLAAGIELYRLLTKKEISISHAVARGVDARIHRDSIGAPLNIQHIITALQPKDKSKPPTLFDLEIHTVILRQWNLTYDVKSEPHKAGQFDPNHINIKNFRADLQLPRIKNDDFTVDVRRFAMEEQSGLKLTDLAGFFHISDKGIDTKNVIVQFPNSQIKLGDISLKYNGWNSLKNGIKTMPLHLVINDGSHITPSDFSAFLPALKDYTAQLDIELDVKGNPDAIHINQLYLNSQDRLLKLAVHGELYNVTSKNDFNISIPAIDLDADVAALIPIVEGVTSLSPNVKQRLAQMGRVNLTGEAEGTASNITADLVASTAQGKVDFDANYSATPSGIKKINANVSTTNLNLGQLINNPQLGKITADVNGSVSIKRNYRNIDVNGEIAAIEFKGYNYQNITFETTIDGNDIAADIAINDPNAQFSLTGTGNIDKSNPWVEAEATLASLNLHSLNLSTKYPGYTLRGELNANLAGKRIETATGNLSINNLYFKNSAGKGIALDNISIEAHGDATPSHLSMSSDIVDCEISGQYNFASLVPQFKEILSHTFPVLVNHEHPNHEIGETEQRPATSDDNQFNFNITIKESEKLTQFAKLPIKIIHPIEINGLVDNVNQKTELYVDAKYIGQGRKLIENSSIAALIDGTNDNCNLSINSTIPTKEGPMPMTINCIGKGDNIDTKIKWKIDREREYKGEVGFLTALGKDEEGKIIADVTINPSEMVFNDSVWTIHKSNIEYRPRDITVDDFNVNRNNQFVKINGRASTDPDDEITVNLLNVNLDYVFESLGLTNVMIGGDATGVVTASGAFSGAPALQTNDLKVKNISYNKAVMGNAEIKSYWDNDRKAVNIDADIFQPNGRQSRIYGDIFALNDSLDMHFHADKINVGFLTPYVAAFASDVTGLASGDTRLWGNFKYIDFEGDAYAENVRLKINMTGVYYNATDSLHFKPGLIDLNNITLRDDLGNTAKLNGTIKHKFFKEPSFNLRATEAEGILAYDITEKDNPDWYGRIFGNGEAWIDGEPGKIEIGADMSSAPNSVFTFVLNDRLDATEYNFITFRDKELIARQDSLDALDTDPESVKEFKKWNQQENQSAPSTYDLKFDIGVTPDMKMILVMDPAGGDQVVAYGSGNIKMGYNSRDEELEMRGEYKVDRGTYNFTLQDIIIKNFSIDGGSSVAFEGDPYNAKLNLFATYTTKANLSDLDESFLQDKELNRTNLRVDAKLTVTGDMRSPELSFDLDFPTLNSADTYRKVRSIISTEEMMNRQIIYLLALNKFYTPDYMASATKGNELVSMASSTISSQLSNILGQLSDNWTIAPNVRSDRGDFSDVEFDLALSSSLLNNRLLFNGNFGYRDKTMNTNQFVGDFDIEYLLNRSGNLRLKAYNRYNDQNFYVKTATTTQGVGIMFRRDFDNMFNFLRRKKRPAAEPTDTTTTDSLAPTATTSNPTDDWLQITPSSK